MSIVSKQVSSWWLVVLNEQSRVVGQPGTVSSWRSIRSMARGWWLMTRVQAPVPITSSGHQEVDCQSPPSQPNPTSNPNQHAVLTGPILAVGHIPLLVLGNDDELWTHHNQPIISFGQLSSSIIETINLQFLTNYWPIAMETFLTLLIWNQFNNWIFAIVAMV